MGRATTAYLWDQFVIGDWTPTLTFATSGDLAVTYQADGQVGVYHKFPGSVMLHFVVITSSISYTTSSGSLRITGAPFTPVNLQGTGRNNRGNVSRWQGITAAGYTQLGLVIGADAAMTFEMSGSGLVPSNVTSSGVASGGAPEFRGFIHYRTAEEY